MKPIFALLFVSILTIGVSAGWLEDLKRKADECSQQTNADIKDVIKVARGSQTDNHNTKCAYSCLLEKYDLMTNGKIDRNKIRNRKIENDSSPHSRAQVARMIEDCLEQISDGDDICDDVYELFVCIPVKLGTGLK